MQAKKRNRYRVYYILAAILLVAGVMIVRARRGAADEPIIRTGTVERGTVTATVSANGILQPLTTVEVKSNVGGSIVKLAVDEGDSVKAGQLIAKIDPTDSQTAYDESKADLDASRSKSQQAALQLAMQRDQSTADIYSAQQALEAAKTRLAQAQEQARIQPALTKAAVSQAESGYAGAMSALKQSTSALIPQKKASAQSGYDQAKASFANAERDFNRQKALLEKGYVAKSAVDAAEEKYSLAKASLDSAKNKLDTITDETAEDQRSAQARADQARATLDNANANKIQDKLKAQEVAASQSALRQAEAALRVAKANARNVSVRQGDIIQAGAQVKRSEASFSSAQKNLSYTIVTSPREGIVTKKYVEEGSIVTAGRSSSLGTGSGVAIVDIADTSRMFAIVNVDETDIAQIEVGQEVDITVEAYPDELFTGKVTKIAPQSVVDQNVTTIPVTVEVEIPDQRLKPGMNCTCDFITGRKEDVVMVPNEAVKEGESSTTVTVMKDEKQITRTVEVGLVGKDYTEIIKGLRPGEKVVTAIIQPVSATPPAGGFGGPGGPGGMGGRGFGGGGGGMGGMRGR